MTRVADVLAELRAATARLEAEHPDLDRDDQAWIDSIDGETSALDLAEHLAERVLHLAAMENAATERAKALHARARRFAADQDRLMALVLMLMEAAGVAKLVRPALTLSARALAPRLACTDPEATPAEYTREVVTRAPDKDKIREALAMGAIVENWHLTNGGRSLAIRTK